MTVLQSHRPLEQVVAYLQLLSPGQRLGYVVMNESEAARREGMHLPLRMQVTEYHVSLVDDDDPRPFQKPEVVGMHYGMVDPYHLELLHRHGKQLHSWTINNASLVRMVLVSGRVLFPRMLKFVHLFNLFPSFKDVGVDAVVTNDPKMVLDAIASRLASCGREEADL